MTKPVPRFVVDFISVNRRNMVFQKTVESDELLPIPATGDRVCLTNAEGERVHLRVRRRRFPRYDSLQVHVLLDCRHTGKVGHSRKERSVRINRDFSDDEKAHWQWLVAEAEKDKSQIMKTLKAMNAAQITTKQVIDQLKAERERQGLSVTELAARCGMADRSIADLENSKTGKMKMEDLHRYAKELGLELNLSLTPPPQPAE